MKMTDTQKQPKVTFERYVLPWMINLQKALEYSRNIYYKEDGTNLLRRVDKIVLYYVHRPSKCTIPEHAAFFACSVGMCASIDINFVPFNWPGAYIDLNNCIETDFTIIDTV
jgi:hypothetical protein